MVNQQSSVNWKPAVHNFGNIEWHKDHSTEFEYTGDKTISSIESSCPCVQLNVTYNPIKIKATWRPKRPEHGFTSSTKAITVKYLDHTRERLYLTATIQ